MPSPLYAAQCRGKHACHAPRLPLPAAIHAIQRGGGIHLAAFLAAPAGGLGLPLGSQLAQAVAAALLALGAGADDRTVLPYATPEWPD